MMLAVIKNTMLYRWTSRILLTCLVITGLFFGLARILLPGITDYRADIERMASNILQIPIYIGHIETDWNGLEPVLLLRDVEIKDLTAGTDSIHLDSLDVSLDLLSSLLARDIRPSQILLKMHELEVIRLQDGSYNFKLENRASTEKDLLDQEAIAWVFEQPDLHVAINRFEFSDRQKKLPALKLEQLGLVFKKASSDIVVSVDALIAGLAKRMKAIVRLKDLEEAGELLRAELYVKFDGVNLAGLPGFLDRYTGLPDSGLLNAELWAEIDKGKLQQFEGRLSSLGLLFNKRKSDQKEYSLDSLQTNFIWQAKDRGWKLQLSDFQLSRASEAWPEATLSVDLKTGNGVQEYLVNASYLRLGDILPAVERQPILPNDFRETLRVMSPDGQFDNLAMQLVFKDGEISRYGVQSDITDFSMRAKGDIPGVTGVDGYLAATDQAGLIRLKTKQAFIDLPTLFRKPLSLEQMEGTLNWSQLNDGWLIETANMTANNSHIKTQSRLSIHLPHEGSPFVDLQTDFSDGDGTHTSHYLPAHILGDKTLKWLDKGVVSGFVEYGTFVLHGKLDKFPYDNKEGTFDIRFKIREGIVDYYKDWPVIDEVEAEVVFSGRGMRIEATAGKIFESNILSTVVEIPDLNSGNPILNIRGKMQPGSQDLMRYLQDTKLAGDYQAALSQLTLSGEHKLDLSLSIPLSSGENKFDGYLDFSGNQLEIPAWQISMSDIVGQLHFTEQRFEAKNIKSDFFGHHAYADIETVETDSGRETHIKVDSHADLSKLITKGNKTLSSQLKGVSPVEVRIEIPNYAGADTRLIATSPLTGTSIVLPQPLGKTVGTELPLRVETGLSGDSANKVDIKIGDQFQLLFFLGESGNKLDGMAIVFGESSVDRLDEKSKGKLFVGGKIESLLLDDWLDWYNGLSATGEKLDLPPIKTELQIDRLDYSQWYMEDMNIQASRSSDDWIIDLSGAAASGQISIPVDLDDARDIEIKLNQLSIGKQLSPSIDQGEETETLDLKPGDIPSMQVEIDKLNYQSRELGSLKADIQTQDDVFNLEQVVLKNDKTETSLSGEWIYDSESEQHATSLSFKMDSKNFGNFLTRHGFDDTVKNGIAKIEADFGAPVALPDFSKEHVSGQAEISIRRGQIVEINPGSAGRIFGLLSFQALPRRLSLDFSDLFNKGMGFDEIDGSFTISDGQAYTNNLTMDAPAGRIDVSGRIGLSGEDYDELVKVTPNVSSSLPLAGALAGGPGLAIVMYITHKLLQDPINKITEIEYKITGPWKKPVVTKLSASKNKVVNQSAVEVPQVEAAVPGS